jgi:hypothetical protein
MLAFCLRYNQRNFPSICVRIESAHRRVLLCPAIMAFGSTGMIVWTMHSRKNVQTAIA